MTEFFSSLLWNEMDKQHYCHLMCFHIAGLWKHANGRSAKTYSRFAACFEVFFFKVINSVGQCLL